MKTPKSLIAVLIICITLCLTACFGGPPYEKDEKLYGTHTAVITIKDYGDITIKLYGDIAPVTVANFVNLVKKGFYDGLTFHRAIDGYMIQGGCPNGDGTGNSATRIYGEFKENGFKNKLSHKRGVISMARSSDYNSASCQFFIMLGDQKALDGNYAAFGEVVEGMEILDQVMLDIGKTGQNGEVDTAKQPIIETIKMVE